MQSFSRRELLAAMAVAGLSAAPLPRIAQATTAGRPRPGSPGASATPLRVERRSIEVLGRPASVFGIHNAQGRPGLFLDAGARFHVELVNRTMEQTLIHWHGQVPPAGQDGVPGLSQQPLEPGAGFVYEFDPRPGTHWMHSHVGLQEQSLMAAPLIVRTAEEARQDAQEVVMFLHDFTFRAPDEVLAELQGASGAMADHAMVGMGAPGAAQGGVAMPAPGAASQSPQAMAHGGQATSAAMDVNDVEFDAYLANDRTLVDPDVVRVERGGKVRLRIVNAAAATNFVIDLGSLGGTLVAVDGNPVVALQATRLPLGIAQRMDLDLRLPAQEGAWPVLALRENDTARTGIILATQRGGVRALGLHGDRPAEVIGLDLEQRLAARTPLAPRAADRRHFVALTGAMDPYAWGINGRRWGEHQPLEVRLGERVELVFENRTPMPHPMHLHGAHFQVVAINGKRIAGAVRDTVLLPANATVTAEFDAGNPGRWALHCHNLYHMAAGMMTEVRYI